MTDPEPIVHGPFVPPQPAEADTSPGYGVPHPPGGPGGRFSADARLLVEAGAAWEGLSDALGRVWSLAAEGWGFPGLIGFADTLGIAGALHLELNRVLVDAAADGTAVTRSLAHGLVETANDVSGTDRTAGDNFRALRTRAGS